MVFNLYVMEGYQHQEIAEQLGISEGTSKSNLFKAKKILKEKIEKATSYNTVDKI
jgi:RNA polymerase sigma-70 factor (ECF subfamily)